MFKFFKLLYARDVEALERSSAVDQHLFYYPPSLLVQLEPLLLQAESEAKTERARMWVRLTREHFDYLQRVSFLLTAYQSYRAEPSKETKDKLIQRRKEFEVFRKHIVDLDDAFVARWFPGYDQFVNFLTANGQNVYYKPWRERRDEVKRNGCDGQPIGFPGPGLIREPFDVR